MQEVLRWPYKPHKRISQNPSQPSHTPYHNKLNYTNPEAYSIIKKVKPPSVAITN